MAHMAVRAFIAPFNPMSSAPPGVAHAVFGPLRNGPGSPQTLRGVRAI